MTWRDVDDDIDVKRDEGGWHWRGRVGPPMGPYDSADEAYRDADDHRHHGDSLDGRT